jgi:hypothetical protein
MKKTGSIFFYCIGPEDDELSRPCNQESLKRETRARYREIPTGRVRQGLTLKDTRHKTQGTRHRAQGAGAYSKGNRCKYLI